MRRCAEAVLLCLLTASCENKTATPGTAPTSKNGTSMSSLSFTKLREKMHAPPISGSVTSFVIPGREGDRIVATVFSTPLFAPDLEHQRSRIGAPFLVQTFDPSTGDLIRSKEAAVGDFGALPLNKEVGFEKFGERADGDQLEARLYAAYDVLAPAYARGDTKLDAAGLVAAGTCKEVFPKYAGPLLLPYYEYLARDFFGWLDKASK
jgi:hypothetical protein